MGNYIPLGPRQRPSVHDALAEAESEHILDCPTADVFVRSGSTLLDAIFLWLMISAVSQMTQALEVALSKGGVITEANEIFASQAFDIGLTGLRALIACLYLVWTVHRFGGTPAKLLLGLRVVEVGTGKTLSFTQTLMREGVGKILSILSVVGLAMAAFRPDRRALHDLIGKSVVKRIHDGL